MYSTQKIAPCVGQNPLLFVVEIIRCLLRKTRVRQRRSGDNVDSIGRPKDRMILRYDQS